MKKWIMVRITRETRDRLAAFMRMQQANADKGLVQMPPPESPGAELPSLDWFINLALDRDDAHRARARKQSNRKKGYTNDPQIPQAEDIIEVVPETPDEIFRDMYHYLAQTGAADSLDSAEYRRVYAMWVAQGKPELSSEKLQAMIRGGLLFA